MDKTKYKITIIPKDQYKVNGIISEQISKKMKRISFPFHLKCLNFNENMGISETKRIDRTKIKGIIKKGCITNSLAIKFTEPASKSCAKMRGKVHNKRVFAGVFKPIKPSTCLVSKLNLAKRNIEKTGIKRAINTSK